LTFISLLENHNKLSKMDKSADKGNSTGNLGDGKQKGKLGDAIGSVQVNQKV
jgi:hypothetical protein